MEEREALLAPPRYDMSNELHVVTACEDESVGAACATMGELPPQCEYEVGKSAIYDGSAGAFKPNFCIAPWRGDVSRLIAQWLYDLGLSGLSYGVQRGTAVSGGDG